MKTKYLIPLALCLITQIAAAQNDINSAWGSTDVRYVHNVDLWSKEHFDYCVDEQCEQQFSQSVIDRRGAEGKKTTYDTCCSTHRPNTFTFSDPESLEAGAD